MPSYDRQVVVQLDFDPLITKNAAALNKLGNDKGIPSELVPVHSATGLEGFKPLDVAKLTQALRNLTLKSRVYLQAHGDWQSQHLSSYNADQVAGLLINCGLPAVKVISVLGCECGRDLGTTNDVRVGNSMDSFGSKFHKALRDKGGLKLIVAARVFCLGVGRTDSPNVTAHGHKYTFNQNDDFDDEATARHRTHSKWRFLWDGSTQRREWAN